MSIGNCTELAYELWLGKNSCPIFQVVKTSSMLRCHLFLVRVGYHYGGDGETILSLDAQNTAAFVRDELACVTNFLLPISCIKFEWVHESPLLEEHRQIKEYIEPIRLILRRIVFGYRVRKRARLSLLKAKGKESTVSPGAAIGLNKFVRCDEHGTSEIAEEETISKAGSGNASEGVASAPYSSLAAKSVKKSKGACFVL